MDAFAGCPSVLRGAVEVRVLPRERNEIFLVYLQLASMGTGQDREIRQDQVGGTHPSAEGARGGLAFFT